MCEDHGTYYKFYLKIALYQLVIKYEYISTYGRHSSAHVQFHKHSIQNKFGYACKICDRLWFEGNLKNLIDDSVKFVQTFIQNVFTSAARS